MTAWAARPPNHSARQKGSDRDIGQHVLPDRLQDALARFFHPLRVGNAAPNLKSRSPEAMRSRLALGADAQDMARRKRADLPEDRARTEDVAEAEIVVDAALVNIEAMAGELAKRGDLGPERQSAILLGEVERFDAERVAHQRQGSGLSPIYRRRHCPRG